MLTCLRLAGSLVVLSACWRDNPYFCEDAPHHNCNANDSGSRCTTDQSCSAPAAVCDVSGTMMCVQCTASEHDACTAAQPVCGDDHACRGCTAHAECSMSLACLPSGACGTDAEVAYVDPNGTDNPMCTQALPCTKVSKALATKKPFIKFQGTTDEAVSINDQNVTLLADPGAKLTRTSNGLLLEIKGSSQVAIYDLEITGASGASGTGISLPPGNTAKLDLQRVKITSNAGGGISATGGTLTVSQSTISGNQGAGISATGGTLTVSQSAISGNQAGGISVSGSGVFVIVGNVFFANGSAMSTTGGVSITVTQSTANRLEFNSFYQNMTQTGVGAAVHCIAGTFTARNNIMSNNGTLTNLEQTGGTCAHAYSIVRPGTLPAGAGNINQDPLFKNTITGDLHIQMSSPAIRAAAPDSDLTGVAAYDIDGDARVSPADLGAAQVRDDVGLFIHRKLYRTASANPRKVEAGNMRGGLMSGVTVIRRVMETVDSA